MMNLGLKSNRIGRIKRESIVIRAWLLLGLVHSVAAAVPEFKQGRYFGWIELSPTQDKIAVVADFYLESPEDLKIFPSLHATVKLTLGGYNTHEYSTETFENVRYDFENGLLTLDDPKNDLVITSEVREVNGNPRLMGDVFLKSSAVFGKLHLDYETDEPEDEGTRVGNDLKRFLPLLDGQYEGDCGGTPAVLQVQSVRGLKTQIQGESDTNSLLKAYGIAGRFGLKDPVVCGNDKRWCTYYSYGGGSYNVYQKRLQLKGTSATDECFFVGETLTCQIRRTHWSKDCTFRNKNPQIKAAKFFTRRFNLSATGEQLKELPQADPPKNTELSNAVRGTFAGYVHNEMNNSYQYLQLNVMPFSFTNNPHNPNQMMISSTATLHLGNSASGPFMTQRFEPRSFYIRPGFTLNGPNTDIAINVSEWKRGFIRGVLYSRAFGRVGTIQLIKGVPPAPPAYVEMVRSFTGEYEGPFSIEASAPPMRWFRFLFPAQPNDLVDHLIRFAGAYSPLSNITTVRNIEKGTFDPFTGEFGWQVEHDGAFTFANGNVDANQNIQMYWPPAPGVFGTYMADYVRETYQRK